MSRTIVSTRPAGLFGSLAELAGRVLLGVLYLVSGFGKITAYGATVGYMQAMGVPALALPLVIVLELAGAVAIIAGWKTRLFALLMAGFTLLAAAIFHHDFADANQQVMFLKNLAIAGGFLLLVAHGAGRLSLDARDRRRRLP